ncbi:hypothetical protein J6590_024597 [Homalodisca vitripennis]|nr:hypothetical protein J6590_024597 [Homalodisca vitripennis]
MGQKSDQLDLCVGYLWTTYMEILAARFTRKRSAWRTQHSRPYGTDLPPSTELQVSHLLETLNYPAAEGVAVHVEVYNYEQEATRTTWPGTPRRIRDLSLAVFTGTITVQLCTGLSCSLSL